MHCPSILVLSLQQSFVRLIYLGYLDLGPGWTSSTTRALDLSENNNSVVSHVVRPYEEEPTVCLILWVSPASLVTGSAIVFGHSLADKVIYSK